MDDPIVERAYAYLRGHYTGELQFEEHLRPIQYIIAPDGRIVSSVMVAMLQCVDTVLFVPECAEGAMEVQVTLDQFDEDGKLGHLADRWRIYHGEPTDVRWAFLDVDAARYATVVIDGPAFLRPNPLAKVEAQLCREINRQRSADLLAICRHFAHTKETHPIMVGIDSWGIDIRRTFDVIRIDTPDPMPDEDAARRVLDMMFQQANAALGENVEEPPHG